jgi:phage gpG-like protein
MIQFDGSINSQTLENGLGRLQARLGDFSPSMGMIAEDFRQMAAEQFASAGAAGGTPWAPLAASTLRRKRGGGGILEGSGALELSLTDPGSPDHQEAIDNLSLAIGTDLPYAMFHQTGAGWGLGQATPPPPPRRGHGVPMRPLLVLTPDRQERWVGFVFSEIQAEMRTLGAAELGGRNAAF